ncbi:uncharacterized protein [Nicotiana sylvestris]|uniref:uncharacterized protein n=1 Tax=Nicotiana sylvestris TaxID=4096 RepID=UPI00388CA57E
MYKDLRKNYLWRRMKKDIVGFVAQFLNCQQVKYEHQRPGGLLQRLKILECKYKRITMDFIVGLSWTSRKFDAIWVIMDQLTKSVHLIPFGTTYSSERLAEIYIREIVHLHDVTLSIILDRSTHFKVLLKVSPLKGVMRFRKKGKLSPRYIRPFEVFQRIGEVAYKLSLLPSLSSVHPLFHVSMLRKYVGDPSHVLDFSTIQLDCDLAYDVEPVAIFGRQVTKLRSKDIALVKVQWRGHPIEEATCETEREM